MERHHNRLRPLKDVDDIESQQGIGSDVYSDSEIPIKERYKKVTRLTSEQWASLKLRKGSNEITFSVTTQYQVTILFIILQQKNYTLFHLPGDSWE